MNDTNLGVGSVKVMITGGSGFIGSAVVRRVVQSRGFDVVNVDKLTYAANPDNLRDVEQSRRYSFVKADICDRAALEIIFSEHQPDVVMHLAAESHVDRSIDGPAEFVSTNIVGTYQLLEAARTYLATLGAERREKFRFHHVSTDEVYGELGEFGQFTETTPYAPNSPYSASKASSDMLVRAWGRTFDVPFVISNCSNNYGPYQHPEKLIPVVILNCISGRPIPVYGAGSNVRDWLYVDDHAEALLTVMERGEIGETYNIGGDAEMANIDLVRTICTILDEESPAADGRPYAEMIEFVTDRPGHDLRYAVDASKIKSRLRWSPSVTLQEGLRATVRWYLENSWWWRAVEERGHASTRLGLKQA